MSPLNTEVFDNLMETEGKGEGEEGGWLSDLKQFFFGFSDKCTTTAL